MGFLGSIGRAFSSAPRVLTTTIGSLPRTVSTTVGSLSNTLVSTVTRNAIPVGVKASTLLLQGTLKAGLVAAPAFATAFTGPIGGSVTASLTNALTGSSQSQSTAPITGFAGGSGMALNIGGLLGGLGGIFGGQANQGTAIGTLGQFASLASGFFPSPTMSQTVMSMVQPQGQVMQVSNVMQRATTLTREIFDAGAKVLSRLGIRTSASTGAFSSTLKRTLSSIASLARRTPSGTMVSLLIGLGLTALEANMLTAWHAQRKKGRRMNAGNPRALRRAARRIKSFHRMCSTIDLLKSRGRRVGTSSRCGSCKKSPCKC
jgi:hypothetical protein